MAIVVGTSRERVAVLRDGLLQVFSPDNLIEPLLSTDMQHEYNVCSIEWLDDHERFVIITAEHEAVEVYLGIESPIIRSLQRVHRPQQAPVYLRALDVVLNLNRIRSVDCVTITRVGCDAVNSTTAFSLRTCCAHLLRAHPTEALLVYADIADGSVMLAAANGFVLRKYQATGCAAQLEWAQNGETLLIVDGDGMKAIDLQLHRRPDCQRTTSTTVYNFNDDSFVKASEVPRFKSTAPELLSVDQQGDLVSRLGHDVIEICDLAKGLVLTQIKHKGRIKEIVWSHKTAFGTVYDGRVVVLWPQTPGFMDLGFKAQHLAGIGDGLLAWSANSLVYVPYNSNFDAEEQYTEPGSSYDCERYHEVGLPGFNEIQ